MIDDGGQKVLRYHPSHHTLGPALIRAQQRAQLLEIDVIVYLADRDQVVF